MKYSYKEKKTCQHWYKKNNDNITLSAKLGDVEYRTFKSWLYGTCKVVRDSAWEKFLDKSGLREFYENFLPFDPEKDLNIKTFEASKADISEEGVSFKNQAHPLARFAKNSEIILHEVSSSLQEKLLIMEQQDDSLLGLFKKKQFLVVRLNDEVTFGVNGEDGFELFFESDFTPIVLSLNGLVSHKVLGFEESPTLYSTNSDWAKVNNYTDQKRTVRKDESLTVYGQIIGKVVIQTVLPLIIIILCIGSYINYKCRLDSYLITERITVETVSVYLI